MSRNSAVPHGLFGFTLIQEKMWLNVVINTLRHGFMLSSLTFGKMRCGASVYTF